MSFLDILSGAGEEGGGVNIGRGMLSGLISTGLDEGMSAASMLRAYRDAGGSIRTYDFQRLVGEVRASQAAAGAWVNQAMDTVPPSDAFVDHTGAAFEGYEYRVPIFYRTLGEAEHQPGHTVFSVRTNVPMTPEQAVEAAGEHFSEGIDTGTGQGQELLGFGVVGLHHWTR